MSRTLRELDGPSLTPGCHRRWRSRGCVARRCASSKFLNAMPDGFGQGRHMVADRVPGRAGGWVHLLFGWAPSDRGLSARLGSYSEHMMPIRPETIRTSVITSGELDTGTACPRLTASVVSAGGKK